MGLKLGKQTKMEEITKVASPKMDKAVDERQSKVLRDLNELSIEPFSLRKGGVAFFFPLEEPKAAGDHSVSFVRKVERTQSNQNVGHRFSSSSLRKSVSFDDNGEDEKLLIEDAIRSSQSRDGNEAPRPIKRRGSECEYAEDDKLLMAEILRFNALQEKGKMKGKTYEERLDRVRRRRQYKEEELRQRTAAKLKQDAWKMMQHEHRQRIAHDARIRQNKLKVLLVKQRCLQQAYEQQQIEQTVGHRHCMEQGEQQ